MRVPVVLVVDVRVGVVERLVGVTVPVSLSQQERDSGRHHGHRECVGPPEALARQEGRAQRTEDPAQSGPYWSLYGSLKAAELAARNSVVLHDLYFGNLAAGQRPAAALATM